MELFHNYKSFPS